MVMAVEVRAEARAAEGSVAARAEGVRAVARAAEEMEAVEKAAVAMVAVG